MRSTADRSIFLLKPAVALIGVALLTGCANTSATRMSANTVMLDTHAAPICGSMGAEKVASKMAAIETIKSGYERYVITAAGSQNNVQVTQLPGQYNTVGTFNQYGNTGVYNGTTMYQPGPTIVHGSHDRSLMVVMFKRGDQGWENALDARSQLGPEWKKIVEEGVHSCM